MNDRTILFSYCFPGTLNANKVMYLELPYPWTLLGVKCGASNATPATIVASGGATIASATIASSGDMNYRQPTTPQPIDANELVTLTLDYDGDGGTASADVNIVAVGLIGD